MFSSSQYNFSIALLLVPLVTAILSRNTLGPVGFLNPLSYDRNSKISFQVVKVECSDNPTILKVECFFAPGVNITGKFTIVFEYQRTVTVSNVEIKMYSKPKSAKSYKPSPFRQKLNFCYMSTTSGKVPNLFNLFLPPSFDTLLKPCPYSGKYVANFTLPLVPIDPKFFPSGDYRLDITFTGDEDVFLWRIRTYGVPQGN